MLRRRQQTTTNPTGGGPPEEAAAVLASSSSSSPIPQKEAAGSLRRRKMEEPPSERSPLLGRHGDEDAAAADMSSQAWSRRNQWIIWAAASGGCAAFNGMFAKLTTNELTTSLSHHIASLLGLSAAEATIEFVIRCTFFGLNMAFNGIMWTLFTTALARGNSTTQVSIINTSTNFVLTALLGLAIFSESLPPLWWVGAAMLVAGNVIIGRKDEGSTPPSAEPDEVCSPHHIVSDAITDAESGLSEFEPIPPEKDDGADEDFADLGDLDGT